MANCSGVLAIPGPCCARSRCRSARAAICAPSWATALRRHRLHHHPEVHAGEDEDLFPVLSERHNIVVIADEAHRTQYGFGATLKGGPDGVAEGASRYQVGYAQHLRDAPPNATFVAFTGTPVSGEDRDTRAVFGDYIHIYDMQQAKEDGATVAIYYEVAAGQASLKQEELPHIDDEVEELAEDEEGGASRPSSSRAGRRWRRWLAARPASGRWPPIWSPFRGALPGPGRQRGWWWR